MARTKAVRGSSWLEFSVALLLIGVFAAGLLRALLQAEQAAERSLFELTASNVRSALRMRIAELMAANQLAEMDHLVGANPVQLLQAPPARYLGEQPGAITADEATWYFDRSRGELVYRFRRWSAWPFAAPGPREGRLSIEARRQRAGEGRPGSVQGVELVVRLVE